MTSVKDARKQLDGLLAEDSRFEYEGCFKIYLDRFEGMLQQEINDRKSEIIISIPEKIVKEFADFLEYNNYSVMSINSQLDIDNRARLYQLSAKF